MIIDITLMSVFGVVVYFAHIFFKDITAREQARVLEGRKATNTSSEK